MPKRVPDLRRRPLAVDLFSGCGGLTSGLKQAGFQVIAAVELDELAVKTYRGNHRAVRVWRTDIRQLPAVDLLRGLGLKPGRLDLLAGCPPCQGFSSIRTLNGGRRVRDAKNDLLFDFLRFVRVLRPRAVMLENVPRLAVTRRIRKFGRELDRMGYRWAAAVLDAADYGVPQRRKRFILIASKGRKPSFAAPSEYMATVRHAIGHLPRPGRSGDPCHDLRERRSKHVRDLIRRIPRNGGSRIALGKERQLACHRALDGFSDVYGRMAWDDVAPTITGGCVNPSKGRFLHPSQNRAITVREAALLQGFPHGYRFALDRGKYAVAEMIGNALPPEFIRRHAAALRRTLSEP